MARRARPTHSRRVGEFAAIAELQAIFDGHAARPSPAKPSASRRARQSLSDPEGVARVELGIGDDAAVLALPKAGRRKWLWTVDTAVEHVHFERTWLTLADLGWRSFHAAASDICAMGGRPWCALSSVIFPRGFSTRDLRALARGQQSAARALGCRIIGGNLARGAELSITTTLLGTAAKALLRSGAKPGDELWLCGNVGLAAAGLRLLQRGAAPKTAAARAALRAFRRPEAQLGFGLALTRRAHAAHAAIDISDGLCGDAAHLARASGTRLVIVTPLLELALSPALRALAPILGVSALELALYGGEDYALLAAGPERARPPGAAVIGCVEAAGGDGEGVWLSASTSSKGKRSALLRAGVGFEHSIGRASPRG